jgi:hypothetical protein
MRNRILSMTSLLFFLVLSALGFAANTPPSNDEIQNWWHGEEMKIEGKPLQIGLSNKEVAYIVPVGFYYRVINFIWHSVLVRPTLKEVREIIEPVRRDCVAHDLNHDGISEIETVSLGSGQGTTIGKKSIVQFDGWKPIVLHQMDFEDSNGNCRNYKSPGWICFFKKEVLWQFSDLNSDGIQDLIEVITISSDDNPKNELKTEKTINRYLFKNNSFSKIEDSMKEK